MKKITLLLLLTLSILGAKAQTTYTLNYDSVRVGKVLSTNGISLYGKVYFKNVTPGFIKLNADGKVISTTILPSNITGLQDSLNKKINTSYPLSAYNGTQYAGKSLYWIGNSLTRGNILVADSLQRFSTLVSGYLSATEVNKGVSGATMMYQYPYVSSAITQHLAYIPTKTDAIRALFLEFGVNDMVRYGSKANYSVANFKAAYDTVIQNATGKGWSPSDIIILSPTWVTDSAYTVLAAGGLTGGNDAVTQLFVNASRDVAFKYGTKFINLYQIQRSNGVSTQLIDGIHPNVSGNLILAKGIYKYLSGVMPGDVLPISITGNAGTVTTNANLTGAVTSSGNATSLGSFTSANLSVALTNETGSGSAVFSNSPTLVTPVIGAATGTSLNVTAGVNSQNHVLTGTASNTGAAAGSPYLLYINNSNSYQLLAQLNASYGLDFWSYTGGAGYDKMMTIPAAGLTGTGTRMVVADNLGALSTQAIPSGGGGGTVVSVGVTSANGFAGTSSGGANPALTLTTTINSPLLAGNGTAISAATTTGTGSTAVLSASPTLTGTVVLPSTTSIGTVSNTEIGYVDGVTSAIQTQIDSKIGLTSLSGVSPIFYNNTTGQIYAQNATTGQSGVLTSTDWNTFNGKANLASPALTGTPTAPTASAGNNSTQIATTAYVDAAAGTSGTYTPTATNGTNVTASTPQLAHYIRVGNQVTVFGYISVTTTAGGSLGTRVDITLPIASAMTNANDLSGTGSFLSGTSSTVVYAIADDTNDRAALQFISPIGSVSTIYYSFMYTVK